MKTKGVEFTRADMDFLKARSIVGESVESSRRQDRAGGSPAGVVASSSCRPLDTRPRPLAGQAYGCLSGNRYEVNTQNYEWPASDEDRAEIEAWLRGQSRPSPSAWRRNVKYAVILLGYVFAAKGFGWW